MTGVQTCALPISLNLGILGQRVVDAFGSAKGVLFRSINPVLRPAAAQNLLRISCTAAHTEAHVERLMATLVRVSDSLGIER